MPLLGGLGALSDYMAVSPLARSLGRQMPPIEWVPLTSTAPSSTAVSISSQLKRAIGRVIFDAETGADPGMTISGLSDTGVSPGRRFQPLILGLAAAIWALTHSTGHDSRDPSGLTLAHQPAHSSASVNR